VIAACGTASVTMAAATRPTLTVSHGVYAIPRIVLRDSGRPAILTASAVAVRTVLMTALSTARYDHDR